MAISNTTKVKFYTGTKAKYVEATHSEGIYFATDQPLIHANGVWTGVSKFELSSDSKLKITTGSKLSSGSSYSDVVLSVDLSSRLPTATQISNWNTAYNFVQDVSGAGDTDKIINKWQEIVDFLAGIEDDSTLSGILAGKANSSVTISAGTGLTGGGNLTANRTLSLAEFGTAGTYYKVTTDKYGRVSTGVASLAISDVTNLQSSLDGKVPTTRTITPTAPLKGGGALSGNLSISLGYVTSEFKVNTSGENVGLLQLNAVPLSKVTGLQTALNSKLETSNIKAGDGISVSISENNVTIKPSLYNGGALTILTSSTDGTKGLAVDTDETTITRTSGKLAIKSISSFVVNNLKSDSTTTALSAAQGKELDGKITSLKVDVNSNSLAITNINSNISSLTTSVSALETQLTWVVVS